MHPRQIWFVDFEFRIKPGGLPHIRCMVAREFFSDQEIALGRKQLLALRQSPFSSDAAIVAYYASAEAGCFLQLGWTPQNFIDLFVEHRLQTNGLPRPKRERKKGLAVQSGKEQKSEGRDSLLGALAFRGLAHIDADEKTEMRQLMLSEEDDLSPENEARGIDYCRSDVVGTEALFRYMYEREQIDWPRALWRGRYAIAAARMERVGVPMDVPLHRRLSENWPRLRHELIADVNHTFRVFDEHDVFKRELLEALVVELNLAWPKLPSGVLATDSDTFDEMARFHSELRPLYEVRSSLGETRLTGLSIGPDGRNRCLLSIFGTITGRNTPSPSAFVFGPARWMRGLIKPPDGFGVCYADWCSQELAISGALSGDERMIAAALSGDPYIAFARNAGLVPPDASKDTHPEIREICKTIVLGINYGMGPESMAVRAGITRAEARNLLSLHRYTYKKFWQWAESTIATGLFHGEMHTKFGWRQLINPNPNVRSMQNWPVQSTGAELRRAAAIASTEAGISVCCPVHDAFLISAPIDRLEADTAAMRAIMSAAAEAIIGIPIATDKKTVLPPDRYMDKRGKATWGKVMGLLTAVESKAA